MQRLIQLLSNSRGQQLVKITGFVLVALPMTAAIGGSLITPQDIPIIPMPK